MRYELVESPQVREDFNNVWSHVWALEGYDEGRPDEILAEYQQYDDFSRDYLFYEGSKPVATMRLVVQEMIDEAGSDLQLPTFKDFDIESEPGVDVEITLLTLLKEYRSTGAFFTMMETMMHECQTAGFRKAVIAGHPRLVAMYRQFGMIAREEPGEFYQGTITIPAILTMDKAVVGIDKLRSAMGA